MLHNPGRGSRIGVGSGSMEEQIFISSEVKHGLLFVDVFSQ